MTIDTQGVLQIGTSKCAISTSIAGINKLTINGKIRIVPSIENTLAEGDSIRLWRVESFEGTPSFEMLNGITWDTSRIQEGLLFVKAIDLGIHQQRTSVSSADIYDTKGRLVRRSQGQQKADTQGLPAGIYIIGGKKVVVK